MSPLLDKRLEFRCEGGRVRVLTAQQGKSGPVIEAQKQALDGSPRRQALDLIKVSRRGRNLQKRSRARARERVGVYAAET